MGFVKVMGLDEGSVQPKSSMMMTTETSYRHSVALWGDEMKNQPKMPREPMVHDRQMREIGL